MTAFSHDEYQRLKAKRDEQGGLYGADSTRMEELEQLALTRLSSPGRAAANDIMYGMSAAAKEAARRKGQRTQAALRLNRGLKP